MCKVFKVSRSAFYDWVGFSGKSYLFTATDKKLRLVFYTGYTNLTYTLDNFTITTHDYTADVVSYSDYYPFGMLLPNRNGNTPEYRYGFNGMEKDVEVKNLDGGSYDFGARMYDPRVGRWLSVDPKSFKFAYLTPYNAFSNNPIINIDPDGNADIYYNGKWIGTDGQDDNLIVVARSKSVADNVIAATKNHEFVTAISLTSGSENKDFQALNKDVLDESINVMKLAIKTRRTENEHRATLVEGEDCSCSVVERASPELKKSATRTAGGSPAPGDISIHSHPIGIYYNEKGEAYTYNSQKPTSIDANGDGDMAAFTYFSLNIIVGKGGSSANVTKDDNGSLYDSRPLTIEVYNSESVNQMSMEYEEVKDYNSKRNNKLKAGFEADKKGVDEMKNFIKFIPPVVTDE
jgi:RHS repeat-associated protein